MNKKILLLAVVVAVLGIVGYRLFKNLSVPAPTPPAKEEISLDDPSLLYFKGSGSGECGTPEGEKGGCFNRTYLYISGKLILESGWRAIDDHTPHEAIVEKQLSKNVVNKIISQIKNSGLLTKDCSATERVYDYWASYQIQVDSIKKAIKFPACQDELDKVDELIKLNQLNQKEQACLKAGGVFVKIGLRDVEVCNFKTTDAGKSCTDSQQCQGSCVAEDANATSGNCTDWKIIEGCHAIFHKGKSSGIVCLD